MTPTKMTAAEAVSRAQDWLWRAYPSGYTPDKSKEALSVLSGLAERCDKAEAESKALSDVAARWAEENAALKADITFAKDQAKEFAKIADERGAELNAARPAIKFYESFQAAMAKGPMDEKEIWSLLGFDPMKLIEDYAREGKEPT